MIQWATKNVGIILNVVILILAVAMAFVPLRWDIIVRDSNGKIRKMTTPGIIFIVFSLGALGFGIWKIANEDKDNQQNKDALSELKTQLNSLDTTMDDEKAMYNALKSDNQDLKALISDLISADGDNTAKLVSRRWKDRSNPHPHLCSIVFGKWWNPYLYPFHGDTVHCDFPLCNDGQALHKR